MMRSRHAGVLLLAIAWSLVLVVPALGQEDEGEEMTTTTLAETEEETEDTEEETEDTEETEETEETVDVDPAVVFEPPSEPPLTLDWTYRFMIPAALVLAVVVLLMTSIRYFTNVVRKRYRIVDE